MTDWTLARIRTYYRAHAELVAGQLIGRIVRGYPPSGHQLVIADASDVLAATEAGVGGFLISPQIPATGVVDRMLVTLVPGDGVDISIAATTALALGELLGRDGRASVCAADGQGGMVVFVRSRTGETRASRTELAGVLNRYAELAPELATTDPGLTAGRILISAAASDPTVFSWAPYSLVPGAWPGVVMPLHDDDVAAASAGMPLEIEPEDVADRIALRGDLLSDWF